ncbi:MAG TPA: F0F1 ATP synthase subunit B [Oceanospirillaceae bacterium]|jgi:F-type H+-transporting ATPase subunit b|nr:F0F1 ATP synthase subunit B [Oceanospirillaceae bacterium]
MNMNMTIIGQIISFIIFVYLCMKYVWPPLTAALAERQKKIAEGLDAADKANRDLEAAQQSVEAELQKSKAQAAELIEQANKRANQIVDEAKTAAHTEGDRIKAAAAAEVEQEVNRAKEALRAQVAALAVAGAEKILGASVDVNNHQELVDKLAAEL